MAYADIKPRLEREFGLPYRTGDTIAGRLFLMGRDRTKLTDSEITIGDDLTAESYRSGTQTWNNYGVPVDLTQSPESGAWDFEFVPDKKGLYRLTFSLEGDYNATSQVTVRVHDPLDAPTLSPGDAAQL